jgi:hypothetical protein
MRSMVTRVIVFLRLHLHLISSLLVLLAIIGRTGWTRAGILRCVKITSRPWEVLACLSGSAVKAPEHQPRVKRSTSAALVRQPTARGAFIGGALS